MGKHAQSGKRLEGYKNLVEYLAKPEITKLVKFSCMVVDKSKYPLKKTAVGVRDRLEGYLKYYTIFLTAGKPHHT